MTKLLLTSGCSFSECISTHIDTWPRHLYRSLQPFGYSEHRSSAMGSQGNGLISRGIIYNVNQALKTHQPQDILVGIMWSGANRHDFRCTDPDLLAFVTKRIYNGWIENPTGFIKDIPKQWVILNHHWGHYGNPEAEAYYRIFYDSIGASISSIEHVLRTQWFLQSKGIRYFFSNFLDNCLGTPEELQHVEIKYLYDQIEQSQYLPVSSEHSWVHDNSKLLHLWPNKQLEIQHPTTEHHKEFTDQVIMPWLQLKEYLPG
jgi:hypothetical protein